MPCMSQLQSRQSGKQPFSFEHGDFVSYELAAQKGSCDQPKPCSKATLMVELKNIP